MTIFYNLSTYLLLLLPPGIFFPVASTRNYVMLRDTITRPMTALTVRFWMRTNDTTISGTPFSYSAEARGGSSNELFVADYTNFSIRLNNAATGYIENLSMLLMPSVIFWLYILIYR